MIKIACALLVMILGLVPFIDWGAAKRDAEFQKRSAQTNKLGLALNASTAGRHFEACSMYKEILRDGPGLSDDEKAIFESDCAKTR